MKTASVEIRAVHSAADRRRFLRFPWKLYQNDPNWVPPIRRTQAELVGYRRHPFYLQAECQTFIALRDGQVCGRIAAILNHAHNQYYNERRGMFGFFESVDDQAVAEGLFDAVRRWFADRETQDLRGPVNPSLNYECGLLVEGFDSPPTFMMTYNPPYYERLIVNAGFTGSHDLYAYYGHMEMLATQDPKVKKVAEEAIRRFHVDLRPMKWSRFNEEVRTFFDIYNHSLPGTWGFVPLSNEELTHMAAGLKLLIVPKLTSVAEVDGTPVGVAFGLLDYNPIIRKIDGRIFPFGWIRFLLGRRRLTRVRLLSTNVLPKYQGWGVGLVLLYRLIPVAVEWGIKDAEFSWVLESNHLSRASLERGGARRYKTYRIYDLVRT